MKSRGKGLVILLAVIAAVAVYCFGFARQTPTVTLNGYLGGEKIGVLEDEDIKKIMASKYHIDMNYSKAGSLEMIDLDHTGMDYLFPSSRVAGDLYKEKIGNPVKSEIIFITPIVFYTHKSVEEALEKQHLVTDLGNGAKGIDMKGFVQLMLDDTKWSDIGLDELCGPVTVATTDPVRSNSGNMFAALLANVLTDSGLADESNVQEVLPDLQKIFEKSGYMESSSGDLFSQFLRTGVGAKPIMAGYESQLLEFAVENPDDWASLKDDIVILYPVPTIWCAHPYLAITQQGVQGIDALLDADVQKIAWEKHGFRTGVSNASANISGFQVDGLESVVTRVVATPNAKTMQTIIAALEE